jgi:hypothetical protein
MPSVGKHVPGSATTNDTRQAAEDRQDSDELTPEQLVLQIDGAGNDVPSRLICLAELAEFDDSQKTALLPLLWEYITKHRDSNNREELIAVGAAIRKYIATMPMHRMGDLSVLLDPNHRAALSLGLELEVAKMIYRNFEVHPPLQAGGFPELAQRLWEMVQVYINPRIILRDKHSAVASLSIEALVAMRSVLAEPAWRAANDSPHRWFTDLVNGDLCELRKRWTGRSKDAAVWFDDLQRRVFAQGLNGGIRAEPQNQ